MKTPLLHIHHPRHGAGAAFTLIELLTVIAIIGILAAIMLPTVGAVRKSAHASSCRSNLRQIALAINLAAADNRDTFRPANDENGTLWPSSLRDYLGGKSDSSNDHSRNTAIVVCASRLVIPGNPNEVNRSSYSVNPYIMPDLKNGAETGVLGKVPVSLIQRPAEIILVADGAQQSHGGAAARLYNLKGGSVDSADSLLDDGPDLDGDSSAGYLRFRHKEKANVAFVDAHVAAVAKSTLKRRNMHIDY